jgi:protein-S-isoprenylcysteine O-methyltransferase Ste14
VAALMGAACSRRIAAEEHMLAGKLGTAYAEYSQRTKRLIPFIW